MQPEEAGYWASSIIIIFLAYVIIHSAIEAYRKAFRWRWVIIILMAIYTFYRIGEDTGTFSFMFKKSKEFFEAKPQTQTSATLPIPAGDAQRLVLDRSPGNADTLFYARRLKHG